MKKLLHFAVLVWVVIFSSCKKDAELSPIKTVDVVKHDTTVYVYPTGYNDSNAIAKPINLGVPVYLATTNYLMTQSALTSINSILPDQIPVAKKHPEYMASSALNTINIVSQTDISVTFVSTNRGYQKTLAYYTYPTDHPPVATRGGADNNAMDKITYIFPNANSTTTSGGLVTGNRISLGSFSAGTSIGFVMILRSWNGVDVNPDNIKYYTQDILNPETVSTLQRHAIMLYDNAQDAFLYGYEWDNRQTGADNDFNDLIFYVKATAPNSIMKTNVPVINTGGQ